MERIESLSPESKVSRFWRKQDLCVLLNLDNISWPRTLAILDNFVQWLVTNTLLEMVHLHNQMDGFKETWELGLCWSDNFFWKKNENGIEIRIWSVGQHNSQSWVRMSCGAIKCVVDSNQNNTEIPADPKEDQLPQTSIKVVAARSKAKAKPQQREPVDTTATVPMHERRWIDIEPSEQILAAYDLSKKVISLLRHSQTVQWEKDGAIEFCRIKFYLRNHSSQAQHWSDDRWKACLAKEDI